MSTYQIQGGVPLQGSVEMHGAKNAALPILAASLLCPHSTLHNCPDLTDVEAAMAILRQIGCTVIRHTDGGIEVDTSTADNGEIPDCFMRQMRSSIVFLGAMLARLGHARVSMPGGCELGPRPIDLHLAALRKLGAVIRDDHGVLDCQVPQGGLIGAEILFSFPSVGATQNAIIAACTARGTTVIRNCAREPEIIDLVGYLNACGGEITVAEDSTIVIRGVPQLHGPVEYTVIPDRIATATYLCAAAATGGDVTVTACCPQHLAAVLPCLQQMGCKVEPAPHSVRLQRSGSLLAVPSVRTMPYPGFPTDAQSPLMSVAALARGTSLFVETIFESRYKQVNELTRMGAHIQVEGRVAVVEGVAQLHSARIQCADLRGGAALCIAALAAQGTSCVEQIQHIDRGYEAFADRLQRLGAKIRRSDESKE